MKKFILILGLILSLVSNARAELYHGINVDEILKTGDWNSKEDVRDAIDNYVLRIQYQKKLDSCPNEVPACFSCYDEVAKGIITNFYTNSEEFLTQYNDFRKSLMDAYWQIHYQNKYWGRGGEVDKVQAMSAVSEVLKTYVQSLLDFCQKATQNYSSIMENYKD